MNIIYQLKNGKGFIKEYYHDGKIKCECEYLYGNKNGKSKEYNYTGYLVYEGNYINGKRNGKEKNIILMAN